MTKTRTYSNFHRALSAGCKEFGIEPTLGRIAVALYERGGDASSDQLEADLANPDGTTTRRGLSRMYRLGLAQGHAADGGPRRPGSRSRVALTQSGRALAGRILTLAETTTGKAAA